MTTHIRQLVTVLAMAFAAFGARAVTPGEWNANFSESYAYAEAHNIPLVVVWGNTSCVHCNDLTNVLQSATVMDWAAEHPVVLVLKHEAQGSQDADNLAAKAWIKSMNSTLSAYPFVGVYWKDVFGTTHCSTAFTGRIGSMPATTPSDDLAGQFVNSLDQLVGGYPPSYNCTEAVGDYTWTYSIVNGEATIVHIGERWDGSYYEDGERAVEPQPSGDVTVPATLGGCPVVGLGYGALGECNEMVSVVLPQTLRTIGRYSMARCVGLQNLEIPASVTDIGEWAFWNCYRLATCNVPAGVAHIGDAAFGACWNLASMTVDTDNKCYAMYDGALYNKELTDLHFWPTSKRIEVPQGVQNIRPYAFHQNSTLYGQTLSIPGSVTNISHYAFSGCALGGLELNEGLSSIGYGAFNNNRYLRMVVIPSTVNRLGVEGYASGGLFSECSQLSSVFFKGNAPASVSLWVYANTSSNLVTFVSPNSTGWQSAGSSELPAAWPAQDARGNGDPREIRTWTTYPYVSFLVRFDLGEHGVRTGGGALEQMVCEGESAEAPEVKASEGYTFAGWDADFSYIVDAKTIGAVYVATGTPMIENVQAAVYPAWSQSISIEYDGLGDASASNLTVQAYYYADGSWNRVSSSLVSGDRSVMAGHHALSIDKSGLSFDTSDVMFKLSVVEKPVAVEIENDDDWIQEGETVWRSRPIGHDEETSLYAYVQGPSALSFAWRASSESVNWDYLECFVDDESIGKIGGETDWEDMEIELPGEGWHQIVWTYCKDSSVSRGEDCGWVSDVAIGAGDVVCEIPVRVTIPEPSMELWAEADGDDLVALVPGFEPAQIYFTLDGSEPTFESDNCEAPLVLAWSSFKKIRAVAVTDDGDWSEMLNGSEYVRITFDPALGTMDETSIIRRVGEPFGDLPWAERGEYEFNGWTPYANELEGWVDSDTEVEEWMTTLYAAWDISVEDIIDPYATLDGWSLGEEADAYPQRTYTDLGYFDMSTGMWVVTGREWEEYAQVSAYVMEHETKTLLSVEFSEPGVLTFDRMVLGWRCEALLDGMPCAVAQNRLKVLSPGEHQLEFRADNEDSDWEFDTSMAIAGCVWTPAPYSVDVSFDAMGGSTPVETQEYCLGSAYGTLPTPTHALGYTFLGWFTDPVEGEEVTDDALVDFEATTLYARWAVDLNTALNNDDLTFLSYGSTGWSGQTVVSHDGQASVASGWLEWNETNDLVAASISGTGVLSFWWRTICEGMIPQHLWLTVDGERMELDPIVSASRADGWRRFTLSLTSNCIHTVVWSVALDSSTHNLFAEYSGDDYSVRELFDMRRDEGIPVTAPGAWIDEVVWEPNADQTDAVNWAYSARQVQRNLPGLSEPMIAWCTGRIADNPNDYEARVRRAIARLKALSENPTLRTLLARYGYSLSDDWTSLTGALDPLAMPETNDAADELAAALLPAIDLMLEDLDLVPTTWQGAVALSDEEYPVDEDIFIDAADVTMARAVLHGLKATVLSVQGYDLSVGRDALAAELYAATNRPRIAVAPFSGDWADHPCSRLTDTNKVGFVRVATDGTNLMADFELPEELPGACETADGTAIELRLSRPIQDVVSPTPGLDSLYLQVEGEYVLGYAVAQTEEGMTGFDLEGMDVVREERDGHVYLTFDFGIISDLGSPEGLELHIAEMRWYTGFDSVLDLLADGRLYRPELTRESIIAAHPDFMSKIRNADGLQEAKSEFATSTQLYDLFDQLFRQRTDDVVHFFEYDPSDDNQLDAVVRAVKLAEASLDEVVTVDGKDFSCFKKFKYTNETVRVTLEPFFDGKILRTLIPPFEGDLPVLSSIPDITFAGTFPDWTMQNMRPWLNKIVGIWYDDPSRPVISAPSSFDGPYADVILSAQAEGAKIYYTTDGSNPAERGTLYSSPFRVCATTLIRAVTWTELCGFSGETSLEVTKIPGIGDVVGSYDGAFENDAVAPWVADMSVRHGDSVSMRSGVISHSESSAMYAMYSGKGTLTFWWKVSCETEDDTLSVHVGGTRVAVIDGEVDWQKKEITFDTAGEHAITWIYEKDAGKSKGQDCGWVAEIAWIPAETAQGVLPGETVSTWPQVSYDWLDKHGLGPRHENGGGTFEQAAKMSSPVGKTDGSGRALSVLDDYIAGTDPNDEESVFKATVRMVDGVPVVSWDPELTPAQAQKRRYVTWGEQKLGPNWVDVSNLSDGERQAQGYKFFKVDVQMK